MEGFFYDDKRTQEARMAEQIIGVLELPAGKYVVFAKAVIFTSGAFMGPSPPKGAGGKLRLELGGSDDSWGAVLNTDTAATSFQKGATIALMLAGEISETAQAKLFFKTDCPDSTIVTSNSIIALSLTGLAVSIAAHEIQQEPDFNSGLLVEYAMRTGYTGDLSKFRQGTPPDTNSKLKKKKKPRLA